MSEWKLVPVEPTPDMLAAAFQLETHTAIQNYGGSPPAGDYWSAMLAAAPPASAMSAGTAETEAMKQRDRATAAEAEVERLREALAETLRIAERNEAGPALDAARAALEGKP